VYVCVKAAFLQLDTDKDGLVQGRCVSVVCWYGCVCRSLCVYVCVKAAFVQLDTDKDGLVQGRCVSVVCWYGCVC